MAFKMGSRYSNTEVEKVFRSMNLLKNKIRNRLSLNSFNSILHIKYGLNFCCNIMQTKLIKSKYYLKQYCPQTRLRRGKTQDDISKILI